MSQQGLHWMRRFLRPVRDAWARIGLCTLALLLGLPVGSAFADYYESTDWATYSHGGTDFTVDTSVTYTISGGQWKVTFTDSLFTVTSAGDLLCSRNRLLANGVLKQDKNWAGAPFPVDSGDGEKYDYYTYSMANWQDFSLKSVWRNDDQFAGSICALGGGVQVVKPTSGGAWSEAGNPLYP